MKKMNISWSLVVIVLLSAAVVYASDSDKYAGIHSDWKNFLFRVANFVIFIGIIYWVGGKKIAEFFKSRRYNIENELADLDNRKKSAVQKLQEVEYAIANIDAERLRLLTEAKVQGEIVKAAIIDKAKAVAEHIKAQAAMASANEIVAARKVLHSKLADLIVDAAQKILEEKLTNEEHKKFIDKCLIKVVFP
ncbi:ATP synthase subunit b [Desulfovibrionales bacterium]